MNNPAAEMRNELQAIGDAIMAKNKRKKPPEHVSIWVDCECKTGLMVAVKPQDTHSNSARGNRFDEPKLTLQRCRLCAGHGKRAELVKWLDVDLFAEWRLNGETYAQTQERQGGNF